MCNQTNMAFIQRGYIGPRCLERYDNPPKTILISSYWCHQQNFSSGSLNMMLPYNYISIPGTQPAWWGGPMY